MRSHFLIASRQRDVARGRFRPNGSRRLGGKVTRDQAGKIVGVNLRGTWINDADMISLAAMPDLERSIFRTRESPMKEC